MKKSRYQLRPSSGFIRDFKKLPAGIQHQILKALREIEQDPYASRNIKKLSNLKIGVWRRRVGDYRIRYDIEGRIVVLYSVEHRRQVYQR